MHERLSVCVGHRVLRCPRANVVQAGLKPLEMFREDEWWFYLLDFKMRVGSDLPRVVCWHFGVRPPMPCSRQQSASTDQCSPAFLEVLLLGHASCHHWMNCGPMYGAPGAGAERRDGLNHRVGSG